MINKFIPYTGEQYSEEEMIKRSKEFYEWMNKRRTVRDFSDRPVPKEVLENIIKTASTAPSGANIQPWRFCLISNKELKHKIRKMAEEVEEKNYKKRMSEQWIKDLETIGTTWKKKFLDTAPWLIVVMMQLHRIEDGKKIPNYYVPESIGIASGFLLAAIYNVGLVAVTYTPAPMNFLAELLNRPKNERPFLLIPVGYPVHDAKIPDIKRKSLEEIIVYYE